MKNLLISLLNLLFLTSMAQAEVAKPLTGTKLPNFETAEPAKEPAVKVYSDNSGCTDVEATKKSTDEFLKLVNEQRAKEQKITLISHNPDRRAANSVNYNLKGQKLAPGEFIYLWIPPDLQDKGTNFMILGHRQNPATTTGPKPGQKWDDTPGLTSVQVYDANRPVKERWRHWAGDASGNFGAKFAEPDIRFELENLYQWSKLGHRGVQSGDFKNDSIKGSVIRLTNVGKDEVEVSDVIYKTNLTAGKDQVTQIFTEGTKFGDVVSGDGYEIGGGQKNKGLFPGAIELGRGSSLKSKLPAGWVYQKGQLMIPIPKGKILSGVELSAGDSHTDQIVNSDGGHGTKGWARLNMEIQRNGQTVDVLMSNENVPPEGILMGSPSQCGQVSQESEYLVLSSRADTTYLGGIRIHFQDP